MAINKIFLGGYVSDDPKCFEIKEGENAGKLMASFTLAEKIGEKDNVGIYTWHQVSVYDRLVETVVEYVKKGMKITVEGKASTHAYINKGNKLVSHLKIRLTNFDFVSDNTDKQPVPAPSDETITNDEQKPESIGPQA